MSRRCEVCQSDQGEHQAVGSQRLRRILIGERIVALCDEHASLYRLYGAGTLNELRLLFAEPSGKRSLISRRSPVDRRIFPARPEGRRRSVGRRRSDAD
jgi:hypothetical protein